MSVRSIAGVALVTAALGLTFTGCQDGASGDAVFVPGGVEPVAGFATTEVMAVSSEKTGASLALLSLDPTTGELGLLPGSPIDVDAQIRDVETLAVATSTGRIYLGSNVTAGRIAGVAIGADGSLAPLAGSPFASDVSASLSVLALRAAEDVMYVGYEGRDQVSQLAVNPSTGALTPLAAPVTIAGTHVETMLIVGDFLYVGCRDTSNVVAVAIDPGTGALSTTAVAVTTATRPDFLAEAGGRLYCSLADAAAVDAFDVDPGTGALTRLSGAPYGFPGAALYELIAIRPQGDVIAFGGESPSSRVGLYTINGDGTLAPTGDVQILHGLKGGPEGMEWSADGRFLYVADHTAPGVYVFEFTGGALVQASIPRYRLPGAQVDLLRFTRSVNP